MAEYLVIRLPDEALEPAQWIAVDSDGTRLGPPITGPLAEAVKDIHERRVLVMVPGADVLTTTVDIPVRSSSRLQAALPYALEEMLAEDVEELHFAAGSRRENGRLPVAVVSRQRMTAWLAALEDAGIHASRLIPEQHGLARIPGTVSMLLEDERLLINDGAEAELILQDVTPGDALTAIGVLDESAAPAEGDDDERDAGGETPTHVVVYCDAASDERFRYEWNALRQELGSVTVKLLPDGALPRLAATAATGRGVNLLQGAYGPKTEYRGLLAPWRYAAMLLVGLLLVGTAAKAVNYVALGREEAAMRERFQAAYQELVPGAPAVDDPVRLVASLKARAGSGGDAPQVLLQALEELGRAMNANEDARIEAISFRGGVADIRMNAASVSVLDSIRQRIEQGGAFRARIQSTDQVGERVSSRLQIQAMGS